MNQQLSCDRNEVEMAYQMKPPLLYFIDSTDHWQITFLFVLMIGFISLHIFASCRSPSLFSSKDENYTITPTQDNYSVELFIGLSKLVPSHRFVDVFCNLIRENVTEPDEKSVDLQTQITGRTYVSAERNDVETSNEAFHYQVEFERNKNYSNPFVINRRSLDSKNSNFEVEIQANIFTDYTSISGFHFEWKFYNPASIKYYHSTSLLLSILILYMTMVFVSFLSLEMEKYTEILTLLLGIVGVLSCNFFYYFIKDTILIHILDVIFLSVFISAFQLYIIIQIYMESREISSISSAATAGCFTIYFLFTLIDILANYDNERFINCARNGTITFQKKISIFFNLLYSVFILGYIIRLFIKRAIQSRRMKFIVSVGLISMGATFVSNVVAPFTKFGSTTIAPKVFLMSIYQTCTSFILFMLRASTGIDYKQVDETHEDVQGESIELDIDENNQNIIDEE